MTFSLSCEQGPIARDMHAYNTMVQWVEEAVRKSILDKCLKWDLCTQTAYQIKGKNNYVFYSDLFLEDKCV